MGRQAFSCILLAGLTAGCTTGEARTIQRVPDVKLAYWPATTKSAEARRHLERAQVFQETLYEDAAYDEFERAVAADSSLGYAYAELAVLGSSSAEAGRYLAAAEARMANAQPIERALIANVGATARGDVGAMLTSANDLAALAPRNPRAWIAVFYADSAAGRAEDARTALRKAIAVDSTYAPGYLLLGRSFYYSTQHDWAQAEAAMETGVRLWPSEPFSYSELGQLRRAQGRFDDAIAAYSRAIELSPQDGRWYTIRGHAELFAGQYERARADYAIGVRRYTPRLRIDAAWRRALVPAYYGQVDSSLAQLLDVESAIDGLRLPDPASDKMHVLIAEVALSVRHGRLDVARHADSLYGASARAAYSPYGASALRQADAETALRHGLIAVYSGDYAAAGHFADEIVRIRAADSDPLKEQPAHFLRGEAMRLQHDYRRALDELALADSNGVAIGATYSRALAFDAMGRPDDARALYQKVADYHFSTPDNAAVHYDAMKRLAAMK